MDLEKLADIQQDQDFDFNSLVEPDEQEKETPTDSPTEANQEKESPSQEGEDESEGKPKSPEADSEETTAEDKTPFHKHPRWQEMMAKIASRDEENRLLREQMSEMSSNVEKGFENIKQEFKSSTPQTPPTEFAELIGLDVNDPNTALAWSKFQKVTQPSFNKDELKKEFFAEFQAQLQQKEQQQQQIMEWSRGELQKLKDSGKTFDENKLLKVIEDYSPVDQNGYTDFSKAYKIYELQEKTKQEKKDAVTKGKKQLSSRADAGGTGSETKKDFVSPTDLAGKDWRDFT